MQKRYARGFTLVELLFIIVIIFILAALAYPVYIEIQERARATEDMNNLRQIGIATQSYLSDNDGVLFSTATSWMSQLHPKYLPAWSIFKSPFEKRPALEDNTTSPVSYGINGNPTTVIGTGVDKISNPTVFILFAPAQNSLDTVAFQGTAGSAVTEYKGTSSPGGLAKGGTNNIRKRINALCADLHAENMLWTTFKKDSGDTASTQRWTP